MTDTKNNISHGAASIKKDMIHGAMWMLGMRWSIRSIGLVSTIILARLLEPEDFGVVAMAMLVVGLLETLSSFGVDLALIRDKNAGQAHYDTAWTFKVLQGAVIALLILIATPFMADYFSEERLKIVFYVLAFAVFINGFENIGVVAFRKELNFSREYNFFVIKKLIAFCVTISLAFILFNYWALVIGIVTSRILGVVISYKMHPYRPKFSLKAKSELWSFSKWMLLMSIARYGHSRADEFLVGGLKSTAKMGSYNVAADLAMMPSNELIMPLSRSLYPGYSKLLSEPDRLAAAFLNVVGFVALVAIPTSLGLMSVANDFVYVILGDKWGNAIPIIEWLSIYAGILAFGSITTNLLIALGEIRWLALLNWSYLALLIPALYFTAYHADIKEIAMARTILFSGFGFILMHKTIHKLPINPNDIVRIIWRPITAGIAMSFIIKLTHLESINYNIITLLLDICVGTIIYLIAVILLWFISGRPKGAEATIIEFIQKKVKKTVLPN